MDDLMFSKIYNMTTGAAVTHREVADWGFTERNEIMTAIDLL